MRYVKLTAMLEVEDDMGPDQIKLMLDQAVNTGDGIYLDTPVLTLVDEPKETP